MIKEKIYRRASEKNVVITKCSSCGWELGQAYDRKRNWECNECNRRYNKAYRAKRKESGNPVISGKCSAEYYRKYRRKYFSIPENKERRNAAQNERYLNKEERLKSICRGMTRYYIGKGVLKKYACKECGKTLVEAHHSNYSNPMAVDWLCRKHHRLLHEKLLKAKGELK